MLAVAIAACSFPALAQDVEEQEAAQETSRQQTEETRSKYDAAELEEITVTAQRANMQSAQAIKREAGTVVDSITADDIGSFPDKSVAEALQRVPGVAVNRFAAPTDTAHFSAEPSGVLVRGLNHVRTEFNGRDSFSANSSRGLGWGDVSPEMMAGVDTYKNQMAELIEGGIAGTVNMRTRVPFDQQGAMYAATIASNYGDLAEEVTPDASALFSNRWETSSGEWGILGNLAYSHVKTRSQGNQYGKLVPYTHPDYADERVWIPTNLAMRDNLYDRTRLGGSLALQWQNADESVVFTSQYNSSEYENAWEEYVVITSMANDPGAGNSIFYEHTSENLANAEPMPAPGTDPFTFDDNGVFQTGTMVRNQGWWGSNNASSADRGAVASGLPVMDVEGSNANGGIRGTDVVTESRYSSTTNKTEDFSANLKWAITDRIRSNFDAQYVKATVESWDVTMGFGTFANAEIDLRDKSVNLLAPSYINMSPGGYANPNNYRLQHIMDHFEDSEGEEFALRSDFEFDLEFDHLESVKVGARYADRDQIVRSTNHNWESVATTWSGNQAHYYNIDRHEPTPGGTNGNQPDFTGYPEGYYELRNFDQDYHNLGQQEFYFANMDYLADRALMESTLGGPALGLSGAGWEPACSGLGDRTGVIEGECVTPAEWIEVSEETLVAYVQFQLGGDEATLAGIPYSGNIGLRYVRTENVSGGGIAFESVNSDYIWNEATDDISTRGAEIPGGLGYLKCEFPEPDEGQDAPAVPGTMGCYISPEDAYYLLGEDQTSVAEKTHHHLLPSFNLKLEFTDELQGRIGLSRAMSRPDIGNLRNFVRVVGELPDINNADDPNWVKNSSGEIVGANVNFTGSAHNPYLKPILADQLDLTLEWYFSDLGSLTGGIFFKEFKDYIQTGRYERTLESNGIEHTAVLKGPQNGDGAKIQGFEIAYQNFFDFLPDPFRGFGVQANYTYLDNQGIENTTVSNGTLSGEAESTASSDTVEVDVLQGLSEHTYNLISMYERDAWSARLAYNWRSEFMVTAIDCCIGRPMWQDDYGQLDGSIQYNFSNNVTVALKASNILNEETVLEQQVQNATNVDEGLQDATAGQTLPASWFQNDRRLTLSMSLRF